MKLAVRSLLVLAVIGALVSTAVTQDKGGKDKDDKTTKVKHSLPAGWKALKLTKDQIAKVYAAQDEFVPKIMDAEKKVADLKAQLKAAEFAVLTADQKAQLVGDTKTPTPTEKTKTPDKTTTPAKDN
jgi:Spy/CpxP family protein refolding chaperone